MTQEHFKKLIENNLDYAELLLVPEESDLELINKDAGLGKISNKQHALLNSWFNSLHRVQQYTKPQKILVQKVKDENGNILQIPLNHNLIPDEVIKQKIKEGQCVWVMKEVPRYPLAFSDLKSRISSMLITSGSIDGFKAELQHSSIHKQQQQQTLEEINPTKQKKWGRKRK